MFPLLTLLLFLPVLAPAQDATALRPISQVRGNSILHADSSYLTVMASRTNGEYFDDSLRTYNIQNPAQPALSDDHLRLWSHIGPLAETYSTAQIGGMLLWEDLIVATHNEYSEWGSNDMGHSIGPLKVIARRIGDPDLLWEFALVDSSIVEREDTTGGRPPYRGYTLPGDVARYGDYLFVGAGSWGIRIYDLTDINSPQELDTLGVICNQLAVSGDRLVVIRQSEDFGDTYLAVYDLTDPTQPEMTGELNIAIADLGISQGYLYVPDYVDWAGSEVTIYDTQGEDAPTKVNRIDLGWTIYGPDLRVSGDRLYLLGDVLHIFSLENPTEPILLGAVKLEHDWSNWRVSSDLLFLAKGEADDPYYGVYSQVQIYNVGPDAAPPDFSPYPSSLILSVFPNPFNSSTTIRFNLPTSGPVHLEVYDPLGRRVRELIGGEWMGRGEQNFIFSGEGMSSGLYYLRVNAGKWAATSALNLVK